MMTGGVVGAVAGVLLYIVFGGIVALIVQPLDRLLRRRLPSALSALLSLLVVVIVVGALVYAVGTPIASQAHALSTAIPKLEQPFISFQKVLATHGINVSLAAVGGALGITVSSATSGTVLISAVSVTVRLAVDMLITLVTAYWLLSDGERLRRGLLSLLPGTWRTETDFVIKAFAAVFGGYMRAQILVAGLVAVLAGLGCFGLGVPFPLVVGVAAGVFELIPLAGPFVGAAIGGIFALTVSPVLTAETLALFVVIHILEGDVFAPRIQARFVHLHPLVTLLALLAGVAAGGFLGAFFAVPAASLLAVIARAHIGDLRAAQPELFTISDDVEAARGRRRTLLASYRPGLGAAVKQLGGTFWRARHRERQ
jgi:predicted PurR-regulated permease PerM